MTIKESRKRGTKRGKRSSGSRDALEFLDELIGEPLTFGTLMSTIRACEEMSQAAFAEKLGVSRSHICDIERGAKVVSPARAAKFARILGYPESQFVRLALQALVEDAGLKMIVSVAVA